MSQWARLPPAEILAIVPAAQIPGTAPLHLRDVVEPLVCHSHVVDWKLSGAATLQPGMLAEFWAWRRGWSTTWSIGPVSNVHSLSEWATEAGHHLGADLQDVLARIRLAEHDDQVVTIADPDRLLAEIAAVHSAVAAASETARGAAIVDQTRDIQGTARVLRTWVPPREEVVLAATTSVSVALRHAEGLVVVHGDPVRTRFRHVVQVDLTQTTAVIVNDAGERLEIPSEQARPIAWLAPTALRWQVCELPLINVWASLIRGLAEAVSAADRSGTHVMFTGAVTSL